MDEILKFCHQITTGTTRQLSLRFGLPLSTTKRMLSDLQFTKGGRPSGEYIAEGETYFDNGKHLKAIDRWALAVAEVEHEMWTYENDKAEEEYRHLLLVAGLGAWNLMSAEQRIQEAVELFQEALPEDAQDLDGIGRALGELEFELGALSTRLLYDKSPSAAAAWLKTNRAPIIEFRDSGGLLLKPDDFELALSKLAEVDEWLGKFPT